VHFCDCDYAKKDGNEQRMARERRQLKEVRKEGRKEGRKKGRKIENKRKRLSKNTFFCNVTLCSLLDIFRRSSETWTNSTRLHGVILQKIV
jgi:hypothetical protein